jgi:HPt (histidine-containing phosphotransfer) domain-containing protein
MDGYLSKPIDVNDLIATVERFGGDGETGQHQSARADGNALFDERAALAYAGGDRKLLTQVIGVFRSDVPSSLGRVEKALRRGDGAALGQAAHALKGAIAAVGSPAGRDAAAELEQMARSARFKDAARAYARLQEVVKQLETEFAAAGLVPKAQRRKARTGRRRHAAGARRSRS